MNEENGGKGGKKYEELSKLNKENHIFRSKVMQEDFRPEVFPLNAMQPI